MSADQTGSLIYGLVALLLVASSLAARRLPMADTIRLALIWVAIFAGGFALVAIGQAFMASWGSPAPEEIEQERPAGRSDRIVLDLHNVYYRT